ncbi:MAG TPA: SAM-dependent methyltransferase [Burkholderiaceae bacterium]|nr:SAM-dependent methyltransferase [Burkholderiaceae bacterium]
MKITAQSEVAEIRSGQSIELLKELHILTREGRLNQDTRRKLKQVYHLYGFIEKLMLDVSNEARPILLADHGAGKSYLGFILYDLFFNAKKTDANNLNRKGHIYGIETRSDLVLKSQELALRLGYNNMSFINLTVEQASHTNVLPDHIDIVTALHACDTATDDAIDFGLKKTAKHMVLVPCCQAEIAATLRSKRGLEISKKPLAELWRHPLHTRELGSQITNVLRCLYLEACGYQVTVTELVGWEHSMKNELILARYTGIRKDKSAKHLREILSQFGLEKLLQTRYHLL